MTKPEPIGPLAIYAHAGTPRHWWLRDAATIAYRCPDHEHGWRDRTEVESFPNGARMLEGGERSGALRSIGAPVSG